MSLSWSQIEQITQMVLAVELSLFISADGITFLHGVEKQDY